MSFGDGSFDVVLSNLCLHNISSQEGRGQACREIARVLKRDGIALISDFKHIDEYVRAFEASGCKIDSPARINSVPPLRLFVVCRTAGT